MRDTLLFLAVVCSTSPLLAQSFVTSPKGMLNKTGNNRFNVSTNRRYQIVDNTHAGTVLRIKSFAMRRSLVGTSTKTAHTVDITLDMGEANFGVLTLLPDQNYLPNTRKNVIKKKNVNFPDWSTIVTKPPAPFDFVVPLDTTFVYLGKSSLLWDLKLENATGSGGIQWDRDYVAASSVTATGLGSGCVATGQASSFGHTMRMQNNGAPLKNFGMHLRARADRAPLKTSVLLSVALSDSNLTIPGWCASVRAVPLVIVPLGVSDVNGTVPDVFFSAPYTKGVESQKIVTQLFAVDAGHVGGIALSNGSQATMPLPPTTGIGHESCYMWHRLPGTPSGISLGGSMVVRFGL
ncbi:MAG: hypothetical protein ACYTGW_11660 [Planctomycetota bacterium]|jgi:hypothetical protein